jgi:hypothetical protein
VIELVFISGGLGGWHSTGNTYPSGMGFVNGSAHEGEDFVFREGRDLSDAVNGILSFFDESVASGNLVGSGPGKSGPDRLAEMRNKIEEIAELVAAGDIATACDEARSLLEKADGMSPPPDFVEGDATANLAQLIQELLELLGCA